MSDRMKIFMLADHPLVSSGVGTQARYLIEGLLKTQKYKFFVFGGAMKHPDYRPQQISPDVYGEGNWIVHPVDGYGDKDKVRQVLASEKPDAMLLFTDPRFFTWVWEMEDEIRQVCPILYWHVWDNDPTPKYNKVFYDSTDFIVPLSLKTYGILQDIGYKNFKYIPHAISPELFKPLPESECQKFKISSFGPHANKKFIVFWNNRNARRKMTGDVVASFAKFADVVGRNNVALTMHTNNLDPEGQNVAEVAKCYGVDDLLIMSEQRVNADVLNLFYNCCDCTINIANNEGFGLATLESLMSGTPIIVHMTGGLQFQIGDWWQELNDFRSQDVMNKLAKKKYSKKIGRWFGEPVFSETRSCTGSQQIPYIYDDRVSHESVVNALKKLYDLGREQRRVLGKMGSDWARETFNMQKMISDWDSVLSEQILKSRSNKKNNCVAVDL